MTQDETKSDTYFFLQSATSNLFLPFSLSLLKQMKLVLTFYTFIYAHYMLLT